MTTLTVNLNPSLTLDDQQFETICQNNKNLNFERNSGGELIIMSPTGSETGNKNSSLSGQLWLWNQQKKLGQTFDSSTGFKLPNGAIRSPDASWIKQEKWEQISKEKRIKFAPICPDFVVELLSVNDDWDEGIEKMLEYIENGSNLGWLLDANNKKVGIFRPNQQPEIVINNSILSGEDILPDFILNLQEIFTD
jgi:Uma2 family endonuclease